jgi:hypothetical protein
MTDTLRQSILGYRWAIRRHRDTLGDDRCWLDDYLVWGVLEDSPPTPDNPPPFDEAMRLCRQFYTYRRSETADPVPTDAIRDPAHWDDDLASMTEVQLTVELDRVLAAVRTHRDVPGVRTIDNDRALYAVLPEKLPADFRLTPEPEFLGGIKPGAGCPNFWKSHLGCTCAHDLHRWGPCG